MISTLRAGNAARRECKCQIRPSRLGGRGVYASEPIGPDEVVAIWGGRIYTADEIRRTAAIHPELLLHPLTITEDFYLGPTDLAGSPDPAEFFYHGCEPNAGVRGQVVLVARRAIAAGEEVCFDYETTECESATLLADPRQSAAFCHVT